MIWLSIIGIISIIFINVFSAKVLYKKINDIDKSSLFACIISYFIFLYFVKEILNFDYVIIFLFVEVIFYFINQHVLKQSSLKNEKPIEEKNFDIQLISKMAVMAIIIVSVAIYVYAIIFELI